MIHEHLPRLAAAEYQGLAYVHWVFTIKGRQRGWLTQVFHLQFREMLLHTTVRYCVSCPAYCLMPDHMHLLLLGHSPLTDQKNAVRFLRTHVGSLLTPNRFQKQSYDHVIREPDRAPVLFERTVNYILANAIGQESIADWRSYVFLGALLPGFPDLDVRTANFWERFWKIHVSLIERHALTSAATFPIAIADLP